MYPYLKFDVNLEWNEWNGDVVVCDSARKIKKNKTAIGNLLWQWNGTSLLNAGSKLALARPVISFWGIILLY